MAIVPALLLLELASGSVLCGGPAPPFPSLESVPSLIAEGDRALEARKYHQAIQGYEAALKLSPASRPAAEGLARAHAGLGVEFLNSGELGPARAAFERSLRSAEDVIARFGLGYVDFLELRDGPARDNLERALARDPGDSRAYKLLAMLDYRRGETAAALRRMDRAAELDPRDEEAQALKKRWAKEAQILRGLSEAKTRHFQVHADRTIHPEAVREILSTLEAIRESLAQALGHSPRQEVQLLLLAEKDFYEATGSYHWVGGVYDGQIKVPVRAEDGRPGADRSTLVRTLRHEYAHVVVKEIAPGCPNWLNEGIAQHFEYDDSTPATSPPQKTSVAAGKGPGSLSGSEARKRKVEEELAANQARRLPLAKVPARLWEVSDQGLARWSYLEGLGFVTYLADTHRGFRLRLLLEAYRREGSLEQAFKSTYGATLSELEDQWWKSVLAKGAGKKEGALRTTGAGGAAGEGAR